MIDGVLVIDKPAGLTSHDVVAATRRALGEPRIGHTGTLDPMATGVLPLACGRATRLVQFLSASDKEYEAEIRLGLTTDTYDITGREVARCEPSPSPGAIALALATLEGDYLQKPPPFSAKKIGGRRAYDLARAQVPVQPEPVPVSVKRVELLAQGGATLAVKLTCSAGFYVRSFAHELGARLGTGACLQQLRRTRSGDFTLAQAVTMEVVLRDSAAAWRQAVRIEEVLPGFPAIAVTEEGKEWVAHGRDIGAAQASGPLPKGDSWVKLVGPDGALLALARSSEAGVSLHPSVVLI